MTVRPPDSVPFGVCVMILPLLSLSLLVATAVVLSCSSTGNYYVADPFVSKQKEIGLKYENGAIGGLNVP